MVIIVRDEHGEMSSNMGCDMDPIWDHEKITRNTVKV